MAVWGQLFCFSQNTIATFEPQEKDVNSFSKV